MTDGLHLMVETVDHKFILTWTALDGREVYEEGKEIIDTTAQLQSRCVDLIATIGKEDE